MAHRVAPNISFPILFSFFFCSASFAVPERFCWSIQALFLLLFFDSIFVFNRRNQIAHFVFARSNELFSVERWKRFAFNTHIEWLMYIVKRKEKDQVVQIFTLLPTDWVFFLRKNVFLEKQGRIHGYRSRVRVGRSSNAKTACKRRKKLTRTDGRTDRPTDQHSGS